MPKKRGHGDGGLYKIRGGKLWRATLTYGTDPETGKPLVWSATSRTQKGAREKQDAARKEVEDHGAPLDRSVTLAQWAEKWLAIKKHEVDPKTWRGYGSSARVHILPLLGRKKVATIKPSDVSAVRIAISEKGLGLSTQKQAHLTLSLMLDAARKEGLCRANVALDVTKPGAKRGRAVSSSRGAFTTEQSVALLAAAATMPPDKASRWWFKIMTGARQTEILGATLADLHLDEGRAYYAVNWKLEELSREHGCGDDPCRFKKAALCPQARWQVPDDYEKEQVDGRWHLTRPKSRTGRTVPLIPQMAEALRRHLDASKDQPNPSGLIWHDSGRPITPREDAQEWRELLVAAGIITPEEAHAGGTSMTGHWARHTAVTVLMALTGGDAQLVGEIVGHSSAEVTEIYRHVREEEHTAAMEALGKAWGKALPKA